MGELGRGLGKEGHNLILGELWWHDHNTKSVEFCRKYLSNLGAIVASIL